jgi:DNA repair exonuclease SbcCD ATPase subunit
MLDAFKKGGSPRQHSDELQALIAASKEERAALSTMLTQVQLQGAKIVAASKALQEVEENAAKARTRLDELQERLTKTDARAKELEAVETRIRALTEAVGEAEKETPV